MDAVATAVPAGLEKVYKKINLRILPFLLICYVFAYLDRINIGFAKLQMQQDLGFSEAVYGFGAGIFFLGYVLFEIPSNLLLARIGVRKTISRIMLLWGLVSASMLFVRDVHTFYLLRFFLGVCEAGFAPGVIFYLTYWYSPSRMARAMAVFMSAGLIGGVFGGPLSTWLMTAFNGAYGLQGWQWMFLVEGLPCVVLGVVAYFFLSNNPAEASWLSPREKELLAADLSAVSPPRTLFRHVLKDTRVYAMAFGYFCLICAIYTVSFWLPTILKGAGVTDVMSIGLYSAIPYAAGGIGMLVFARISDHYQERRWHSAIFALLGAVALLIATFTSGHLVSFLISISFAAIFIWSSYNIFWAMPSAYLQGNAAAGGIALINSIGLLGGFVSPSIIGWAKTTYGSLDAGLYTMSILLAIGGICIALNRLPSEIRVRNVAGNATRRVKTT